MALRPTTLSPVARLGRMGAYGLRQAMTGLQAGDPQRFLFGAALTFAGALSGGRRRRLVYRGRLGPGKALLVRVARPGDPPPEAADLRPRLVARG